MKKYAVHVLAIAGLLAATSAAWAQAPGVAPGVAPIVATSPRPGTPVVAPALAPAEDEPLMGDLGGIDEGDLYTWLDAGDDDTAPGGSGEQGDDSGPGAGMRQRAGIRRMGGMAGGGGTPEMAQRLAMMAAMNGMRAGMRSGSGMRRGRMAMGMHMRMVAERLGLSDAQRERLRDIREHQMRNNIQSRADLQLARMDMRKLMREEHVDRGAVDAQVDKIARLRTERAHARVAAMLDARDVLTPEQRRMAREMRMRGPMGMDGPGGRGMKGDGKRGAKSDKGDKDDDKPEVKSRL